MPRYIDADTLKAEFTGNFTCAYSPAYIKAVIDSAPTVDAEPIRHGHWTETLLIMRDENGDFILTSEKAVRCSECCRTFDMKKLWARDFCLGCGAKMDQPMEVKDDDE